MDNYFYKLEKNNSCTTTCKKGTYPEISYREANKYIYQLDHLYYENITNITLEKKNRKCIDCSKNCSTCILDKSICLTCKPDKVNFYFYCLDKCPYYTYPVLWKESNQTFCEFCPFSCEKCDNDGKCLKCRSPFQLKNNNCYLKDLKHHHTV